MPTPSKAGSHPIPPRRTTRCRRRGRRPLLHSTWAGDDVTLARGAGPQEWSSSIGCPWIYPFQQGAGPHAEPNFVLSRYPSLDRVPRGVGTGRRLVPLGGRPGALAAFARYYQGLARGPGRRGAPCSDGGPCRDCLRLGQAPALAATITSMELHFDRRHHRRQQQCARQAVVRRKWGRHDRHLSPASTR